MKMKYETLKMIVEFINRINSKVGECTHVSGTTDP